MKGIILAAGNGSRLLPLTKTMPKCLVEVGGRAILDHQLDALAAAGIGEAVVVAGYRGQQVVDHLAAQRPPLPTVVMVNPFYAVSSSIGSVWAVRDHLAEPFCLMNGDTVFAAAIIADAVEQAVHGVNLLVEPIDTPELDDMLVEVDRGQVRAVSKDLAADRARHRSLGVIVSTGGAAYRAALDAVIAGAGGIHAYHHDIIARLALEGEGVGALIDRQGGWQEIDRPEDIDRWNRQPHPGRP